MSFFFVLVLLAAVSPVCGFFICKIRLSHLAQIFRLLNKIFDERKSYVVLEGADIDVKQLKWLYWDIIITILATKNYLWVLE